jgi:hypothetical protein
MRRVWRLCRHAVLLEIAIWRCLGRWVARRPDAPPDAVQIAYAQLVGPVLWLWIFGSVVEVVALELVLRSIDATWAEVVRLPLLVAGVWGALWMLGLAASYRVRRHLLLPDRLVLRDGPRARVEVPLAAVEHVRLAEHEWEGMLRSVHDEDGLLLVGPGNRTNVELTLAGPTGLAAHDRPRTATTVGLWADDPRLVVRLLRDRLEARSATDATAP